MIERPQWNLTVFKVHFGLLTLKGYTKGEHVLRFEAIVHNTKALHTGRVLEKFPAIVARLAGMVDRFTSMLDCVDVAFLPDGILDQLPTPSQIGATRVGGIDLNRPRIRNALTAVLALAVAPEGFTVADLAAKVRSLTGQDEHQYTDRQAAYDLRKLRGKQLVVKPGRTRRYQVPGRGRPHHRRATHPARPGHRPDPRRRPPTRTGTTAEDTTPASTATTTTSGTACAPCSTTSPSTRPHRQQIVDPAPQAPRRVVRILSELLGHEPHDPVGRPATIDRQALIRTAGRHQRGARTPA